MLVPDCRRTCSSTVPRAVDVGDRLGIGFAVLDPRDVADPDRMAVLLADDDVVELGDASGRGRACAA